MFEVGAVRKTRKLARISVVLGVILLFSSIGITLTAAAPNENAPGQDQCEDGHGATDNGCKPDNEHGQDCAEHGNGGVNEDHCLVEETTGGSTGGSSTGEGTGNATGNSTGEGTGNATGNSTGEGTGNATGNSTGEGTGNATGNATGNSTGEGTGNATGNATGNSTGNSTGNATGNSTGESTTGGTETGTTTGETVVEDNKQVKDEVLGRVVERKALATTGSATTILAVLGFGLLMIGSFLRFGRFGTQKATI